MRDRRICEGSIVKNHRRIGSQGNGLLTSRHTTQTIHTIENELGPFTRHDHIRTRPHEKNFLVHDGWKCGEGGLREPRAEVARPDDGILHAVEHHLHFGDVVERRRGLAREEEIEPIPLRRGRRHEAGFGLPHERQHLPTHVAESSLREVRTLGRARARHLEGELECVVLARVDPGDQLRHRGRTATEAEDATRHRGIDVPLAAGTAAVRHERGLRRPPDRSVALHLIEAGVGEEFFLRERRRSDRERARERDQRAA